VVYLVDETEECESLRSGLVEAGGTGAGLLGCIIIAAATIR
jgi:hypothetical protein